MKFFLLALLTLTTMAGAITTNEQGDVIFDDGAIVYNDEVVDTGPIEPIYLADSCDIGVQFTFRSSFDSLRGAQDFCRGFEDLCRTRRFSDRFYESNYRRRIVFRGRGNDRRGGRANAFNLYFEFINQGKFHVKRFSHQFFFSDNCS